MDTTLALEIFIVVSILVIAIMQLHKSLLRGWKLQLQGWKLWVVWNLVTDVGLILALTIYFYTIYIISQGFEGGGQVKVVEVIPVSTIGGLLGGLLLGLFQWLVMRSKISRASRWIWATSIGWALSVSSLPFVIISNFQTTLPVSLTILVLFIMIFPLAQWLVIRNEVQKAGWWVLANAIGFVASFIVIYILGNIGLNLVVGLMIGFVIPGMVTGFALLYLLRQPKFEAS